MISEERAITKEERGELRTECVRRDEGDWVNAVLPTDKVIALLNALDAAERKLDEEREERRRVVEADDFRYRDLEAKHERAEQRIEQLEAILEEDETERERDNGQFGVGA